MRGRDVRTLVVTAVVLLLAGGLVASVGASTRATGKRIAGTPKADKLRGTPGNDAMTGRGGNDTLLGFAGDDVLDGGPGDDKLAGGKGRDRYRCGPGKDTVVADESDVRPGSDCEVVIAPVPELAIADVAVAEGNVGTTTMTFTVDLTFSAFMPVTVAYTTANGTAIAPGDYASANGTLTFKPGEVSKSINVAIVGETVHEQDETFTVGLSRPVNATIGQGSATGTITNDDVAAKPGHYHGPIVGGGLVDFDVSADSTIVSNLVLLPYETCNPPSGSGLYKFTFGSTTPILPDLSFRADGTGTGVTVSFGGKFTGDGSMAAGTIQVKLSYDENGVHYDCDTGSTTWVAAWMS